MKILLTISMLALIVLLWAAASMMQHVRVSRRRREALALKKKSAPALVVRVRTRKPQVLREDQPATASGVLGISGAIKPIEVPAPMSMPPPQVARFVPAPIPFAYASPSRASIPVAAPLPHLMRKAEPIAARPPAPPIEAVTTPEIQASTPVRSVQSVTEAELPLRQPPRRVEPEAVEAVAATPAVSSNPFARRPVGSVYPQPAASTFGVPARRPDWAYFNKDMGDLSDPLPGRLRERIRARG